MFKLQVQSLGSRTIEKDERCSFTTALVFDVLFERGEMCTKSLAFFRLFWAFVGMNFNVGMMWWKNDSFVSIGGHLLYPTHPVKTLCVCVGVQ